MEEILASIRKIISEDSNDQQPQAAPAPQPVVAVAAEADVLELTHEVQEAPVAAPQPMPEPARPQDDVVFQTIEESPVTIAAQSPVHSTDGLVSDKTRNAIDDALSGLDFGPNEQASPAQPVAPLDARSIEAIFDRAVRETFDPVLKSWLNEQAETIVERMKPAIREWMEENLPAMMKSAVEAEVARAVRARTKR